MAVILRDAKIDATSGAGTTLVRSGDEPSPLEDALIENSTVDLGELGTVKVQQGQIELDEARAPRLVVILGSFSGGAEIRDRVFELPLEVGLSGGKLVPATPQSAFPEGQSDDREARPWLGRLMYGRAR